MKSYARHPCRFEPLVVADQWGDSAPEDHPLIHAASTANAVRLPRFAAWIAASVRSQHAGNLYPEAFGANLLAGGPVPTAYPCRFLHCHRGEKTHQSEVLMPTSPARYGEQ